MAILPPSSFHGSLVLSSAGDDQLCFISRHYSSKVLCSVQSNSRKNVPLPSVPIRERHITSSLASSLLCQQMRTPQGEALMAMANEGLPHGLISQAAAQQLELLAATSSSATSYVAVQEDQTLHRRIEEVKEKERRRVVQEISFALVASRLLHTLVAIPENLQTRQDAAPLGHSHLDDRLQAVHPHDVQPLTARHVAMVINGKDRAEVPLEPSALARCSKLEMGMVYAGSVMHGYFLARLHQRLKLERSFGASSELEAVSIAAYLDEGDGFNDHHTLHQMSIIRSSHTLEVIEHHCQALFGGTSRHMHKKQHQVETSQDVNTNTMVSIQVGFVRSLIYQALAFGALLWDVEHNFVPPLYPYILHED